MIGMTEKIIDRAVSMLQALRRSNRPESLSTPAGEETWRGRRRVLLASLNKQADDLLDLENEALPDAQPAGRRA